MADTPRFEVVWGGNWSRASRRAAADVAHDAVVHAQSFVVGQSIEVREPKRFRFLQRRPSTYAATCHDARRIDIALNRRGVRKRAVDLEAFCTNDSAVHEVTHAARFERFPGGVGNNNGVREHAATEGLAYTAALAYFMDDDDKKFMADYASYVHDLDESVVSADIHTLATGRHRCHSRRLASSGAGLNSLNRWYVPVRGDGFLSRAENAGVYATAVLLDRGYEFAELIELPAPDLLAEADFLINAEAQE